MPYRFFANFCMILLYLPLTSCDNNYNQPVSEAKVTFVHHTPVKQQTIGNCWLYAKSSWLESLLKVTNDQTIKVSESYWTYWDFYVKLRDNLPFPQSELNTAGSWQLAKNIINEYGWVEEQDFIAAEADTVKSESQKCATDYITAAIGVNGPLHSHWLRTPELIRSELDKAFSCSGKYQVDMTATFAKRRPASQTILQDIHTGELRSLTEWLDQWLVTRNFAHQGWNYFEGKKLPSTGSMTRYRLLEQRIKKALNDHQPVVLSFYVSFNAPNQKGLFNLNTLAERGGLGESGGHMLVLHDYTVDNVPGIGRIGEGEMSEEIKAQALRGDLDYLIAKNSWGYDRDDRPWLGDGYSRISWKYLTSHYYDEDSKRVYPFMMNVVFPPGY